MDVVQGGVRVVCVAVSQLTECGSYTAPASTPEPSPASSRTTGQPWHALLWHALHMPAVAACCLVATCPRHGGMSASSLPATSQTGYLESRCLAGAGLPPAASSGDTNWVKAALLTLPQTSLPLPFQLIATSQTWTVDTDTGLAISQCWCQQWWHGEGSQSNNHCT